MINADNIGKRIKLLRKQKGISQEKMAFDLGMYQADISNLERAIVGSGISDIFKLEAIADYLGISFVELIAGFETESHEPSSEIKKPEEYKMKDYVISGAKYGDNETNSISELQLTAPDGKIIYASFIECDRSPYFFMTSDSIYKKLVNITEDKVTNREIMHSCFLKGNDYVDVFENVNPEWRDICRYLIFIATENLFGDEQIKQLVADTTGKAIKDIQVPVPEKEPEEIFSIDFSDLSVVYRYRLMIEAELKNPSVYADIDDQSTKQLKNILAKLKTACVSEEAYKVWKKDLIDAKLAEVMEKKEILACPYLFAGIGQYKAVFPKEGLESFYAWIDGNGSAFCGEPRPATKQEIRTFVSQHIADKLLDIPSPID